MTTHMFNFSQPWWLLACLLAVPLSWMAWHNLAALGRARQAAAIVLRALVVAILAILLARPTITSTNEQLTLIAVVDRSQSVPQNLQKAALSYLWTALAQKDPKELAAVVDVAEAASIANLPSNKVELHPRNTALTGLNSKLSAGIEMAMAIAPPNTAVRILLVSDGNENVGDIREASRRAAANGIPIDVLPLRYRYSQEVVFKNLVAPVKARSGQTIPLRFVLSSTGNAKGRLELTLNGNSVKLDPSSDSASVPVELKPGTNVKTLSLPLAGGGMHEFRATFIPADPNQDSLEQNNSASAMTFVSGPGHVLVLDKSPNAAASQAILGALKEARISARLAPNGELPERLPELIDCDAIILVDMDNASFTLAQQEMLCRYVTDMGGGLVMVGGPNSFGAGGWIGSPLAEIMPVDMDPPQKKQMPMGALVLIMHACEMPNGNYWGKQVAIAAVNTLSRLDLAGVLDYSWQGNQNSHWVWPLSEVGDKKKIVAAINQMEMGDMPDFGAPMREAYDKLSRCGAGQKHVIIISDGDPQMPPPELLGLYRKAGITVSGVAVYPHANSAPNLLTIAQATGGRFYEITEHPEALPQIFIKEAQVIRRPLIVEEKVDPRITSSIHEIMRGINALPSLGGYILTGPRGGLAQLMIATPKGDPILAAGQFGLGRTVAFTSSADSRWGGAWLGWAGFDRIWEQIVRWAGKPSEAGECEVFTDVQGRQVTVTIESVDASGKFVQFSQLAGQVIAPDMTAKELTLTQVGPGRYRGEFQADAGGSYLFNLRYKRPGQEDAKTYNVMHSAISVPYAPEFRDLTDNSALLAEVAAITGGRVMPSKPEQAKLFDRTGVKFPTSAQPLNTPMLLVWLAVFLTDVAVRRIAVDAAAMARRVRAAAAKMLPRLRRGKVIDSTLDRLKSRRQEHLEQLARRRQAVSAPAQSAASARYEAPAQADTKLETARADAGPPSPPPAAAPPKKEAPAKGAPATSPHLEQLLRAKRKAQDRLKGRDNEHSTGEP